MNDVRRITFATYVLLAIAGTILLFVFPPMSAGRLFGSYVFLFLVVTAVSWLTLGSRHAVAMAYARLLTAALCLGFSILMAAYYWMAS